jgi:D-tyrosyl-tRNA(Tyr) deacylase
MIGLLQRVSQASVSVGGSTIGAIHTGLLVLIGVEATDEKSHAEKLLNRILNYRVFPDDEGRMNRSLATIQGGLLLVPQFTLVADTNSGTRPSFSSGASPEQGRILFDYLVEIARKSHEIVQTGQFGADMQVSLINDGPVTFWLETKK